MPQDHPPLVVVVVVLVVVISMQGFFQVPLHPPIHLLVVEIVVSGIHPRFLIMQRLMT
jgi:hypothetical protein